MPSFKKIISAFCAAAIAVSGAVMPVLADEQVVLDLNYTELTEDSSWKLEDSNVKQTFDNAADEGMRITNSYNNGNKLASKTLATALADADITIEYETQMFCNGNPDVATNILYLGADKNSTILEWQLDKYAKTGRINGNEYINEMTPTTGIGSTDRCTPWLTVTHRIDFANKTVATTIGDADTVYYESAGDKFVDTSVNSFGYIGLSIGRSSNFVALKNLKITTVPWTDTQKAQVAINNIDLKTFTKYGSDGTGVLTTNNIVVPTEDADVYGVSAGTFGIDANLNGVAVDWESDNTSLVEITGRNEVTVNPTSSAAVVHLTATATDYPSAKRVFTLNIQGTEDFLKYVASQIDLTEGNSTVSYTKDESGAIVADSYDVISNFTVPENLSGATIKWSSNDNNVSVGGGNISLNSWNEGSYTITATISSAGKSYPKDFTIVVPKARVFYNDSFDDWATGNLVALDKASNNDHDGYSLSSGTRNGNGEHYIAVAEGGPATTEANKDKFINNVLMQYNDDGSRPHSMTFTKMSGASNTKDLYATFDFRLNNDTTTMRITNGAGNIDLSKSLGLQSEVWYHMELTVLNNGDYTGNITNYATGKPVKTITGSNGPTTITSFTGTSSYYSFAFNNLYIAAGNVPGITPTGKTDVTIGKTTTIATVARAKDIKVDLGDLEDSVTYEIVNGAVILTGKSADKGNVTITATSDIEVSSTIEVVVGTDKTFADEAADALLDKLVDGSNVTKGESANTIVVSKGDLTLPNELYGASITWTSKNSTYVTDKGVIYPAVDAPDTIELTADTVYGEGKGQAKITVDISAYKALVKSEYDKAMSDTLTIPYKDSVNKGKVNLQLSNSALILNDIKFPTDIKGEAGTIAVEYDVEENDYLSSAGVISVPAPDKKYGVTINRTVTYKKGNVTLAGGTTDTFKPSVYFGAKYVEDFLTAPKTGALWNQNEEWELRDDYLKEMVYDYVVRFDAACDDNFDLPKSTTKDFEAKAEGVFGSSIEWSSNSTAITASSGSDNENKTVDMKVKQPSNTANVTLTASMSYKNGDTQKRTFKVSVTGTGSGSTGGNGGGSTGGSGFSGGSSGGGTRSGSSSPVISGTTFIPVDNTGVATPNPNPSGFNDLDSVPWAVTAINNLCVSGVVNGKAPGLFCPNDNITRAEFAKILVGAFAIPTVSVDSATFTDVSVGHWASAYVETAYQNGIITGYDNGAFDPDAYVTRQDMAVMVQRAASVMGYALAPVEDAITFTDAADIAAYAQEAVSILQQADIVNGVGDGAFEPLSTSTRAQACQMLYNVWN